MKFNYSKIEYDDFIENCLFTDREKELINLSIKGLSNVAISFKLNCSIDNVNKIIRKINKKILKRITSK